jgi:hypothetical protein
VTVILARPPPLAASGSNLTLLSGAKARVRRVTSDICARAKYTYIVCPRNAVYQEESVSIASARLSNSSSIAQPCLYRLPIDKFAIFDHWER